MIVTPRDIARIVKWEDVFRAFVYFFPASKRGSKHYRKVFNQIRDCRKKKAKDPEEVIELNTKKLFSFIASEKDSKFITEHYGTIEKVHDEMWYSTATNKFSMSFRSWDELSNIPISVDTLDHFMFEDFLAHFIWEITFFGTEERMKKQAKVLTARMKEVKKKYGNKKKEA